MIVLKKNAKYSLIFLFVFLTNISYAKNNLIIAGLLDFNVGLGKITYGLIDQLSDEFLIDYYPSSIYSLDDDPYKISKKVHEIDVETLSNKQSGIFLYIESVQVLEEDDCYENLSKDIIKYAYSMIESTMLPAKAVEKLNTYFDAVIVPDKFLIDVYKNSGVTIPIICIPTGLYLDKFFLLSLKNNVGTPFVFGCVATRYERKNLKKLITCFNDLYGNNKKYLLKIHAADYFQDGLLESLVKSLGAENIIISADVFDEDAYVEFMHSLDCYVLISKGEGFSNTPREAMAAGIPVIVSYNTGHSTLVDSGYVSAVECYAVEADYQGFIKGVISNKQFDCTYSDVKNALQNMINNYSFYQKQREKARNWVRHYSWQALKDSYTKLFNVR